MEPDDSPIYQQGPMVLVLPRKADPQPPSNDHRSGTATSADPSDEHDGTCDS